MAYWRCRSKHKRGHEFTAAYAGLNALQKIGHLPQKGIGEAARRAPLELGRETTALQRSQPDGATRLIEQKGIQAMPMIDSTRFKAQLDAVHSARLAYEAAEERLGLATLHDPPTVSEYVLGQLLEQRDEAYSAYSSQAVELSKRLVQLVDET
ncbi:hypothetical protein EDB99_107145 [Pseudomonas sp. 460]|nr:hypothetical protein EDB99_107145 [Pseudomonas sp. 460]